MIMEFDNKDIERFWSHVWKGPKCWTWIKYKQSFGHGQFKVKGKKVAAHRFAYAISYGDIPEGKVVRHKCHNADCVRPDHLRIGTHAENVADRVSADRSAKGESNGRSKLTSFQVASIKRSIRNKTMSIKGLSKKYGVGTKAISNIRDGVTWRHIQIY